MSGPLLTQLEAGVEFAKVLGAVVVALGGAGGLVRVMLKRFPPRSASLAQEVAEMKAEQVVVRADMRKLTDYVHDLREHIADGKPPPPPDWPEGLRL